MKDLFVNKAGVAYPVIATVPGVWKINDLAVGAVGVFNADGSICDGVTVAAQTFTGDYIQIATKLPNGEIKQSVRIYRKSALKEVAYNAPVAPANSLGAADLVAENDGKGSLNMPSTLITGQSVSFAVRDLSKEMHDETSIHIVSIPVRSGDVLTGNASDNIVVKAVAEYNSNPLAVAVATVVSPGGADADGILFTGKTVGSNFAVMIMQGLFQDADLLRFSVLNDTLDAAIDSGVIAYEKGNGTPEQIRESELAASLRDGNINTQVLTKHMWNVPSAVEDAVTYDQLVLTHISDMSDAIMRENQPMQTLNIAGAVADIDDVKRILTGWVAGIGWSNT